MCSKVNGCHCTMVVLRRDSDFQIDPLNFASMGQPCSLSSWSCSLPLGTPLTVVRLMVQTGLFLSVEDGIKPYSRTQAWLILWGEKGASVRTDTVRRRGADNKRRNCIPKKIGKWKWKWKWKWVGSRHPIQMLLTWKWPSTEIVILTNGSDQSRN